MFHVRPFIENKAIFGILDLSNKCLFSQNISDVKARIIRCKLTEWSQMDQNNSLIYPDRSYEVLYNCHVPDLWEMHDLLTFNIFCFVVAFSALRYPPSPSSFVKKSSISITLILFWKCSVKIGKKSSYMRFLSNRYKFWGGGNTSVLPVAAAMTKIFCEFVKEMMR